MFPTNILVRYIQPQRMIGSSIVIFGVLVLCLSAAKSYDSVLAIRILNGCFQCSVQAFGTYTPYWYQRNEVATRAGESELPFGICKYVHCKLPSQHLGTDSNLAAYYSAATLSGAFSGLIAYGVEINLDGVAGRRNWQWLFIIEGALAVGVGIAFWLLLPPFPDQIKTTKHWLFSSEEIALAKERARCKLLQYLMYYTRGC